MVSPLYYSLVSYPRGGGGGAFDNAERCVVEVAVIRDPRKFMPADTASSPPGSAVMRTPQKLRSRAAYRRSF